MVSFREGFRTSAPAIWSKLRVVLTLWAIGFCALFAYAAHDKSGVISQWEAGLGARPAILSSELLDSQGVFGNIRYVNYDPEQLDRLRMCVNLEGLQVEAGQIAHFQTSAYRTLRIQGMQVKAFAYPDNPWADSSEASLLGQIFTQANIPVAGPDMAEFIADSAEIASLYSGVDLTGIAEVVVNGFKYERFENDRLGLAVQSKLAMASYRQTEILLRGHVTITAEDGTTLQSNCVKWNLDRQLFVVPGTYFLQRNDKVLTGKCVSLDANLNVVSRPGDTAENTVAVLL